MTPYLIYYGHDPAWLDKLSQAEFVILERRGWSGEQIASLRSGGTKVLAYISPLAWPDWMGKPSWWWGRKSRDEAWGAWWMSLTSPGWRRQVHTMWGEVSSDVDGLFLDNLDRLDQDRASLGPLVRMLQQVRNKWPGAFLLGNRGFAHWPSLSPHLNGILFENLTDAAFGPGDKQWVQEQLFQLQGTRVFALDYATRRVSLEAERLRTLFPQMSYYCAPDESLQSLS